MSVTVPTAKTCPSGASKEEAKPVLGGRVVCMKCGHERDAD